MGRKPDLKRQRILSRRSISSICTGITAQRWSIARACKMTNEPLPPLRVPGWLSQTTRRQPLAAAWSCRATRWRLSGRCSECAMLQGGLFYRQHRPEMADAKSTSASASESSSASGATALPIARPEPRKPLRRQANPACAEAVLALYEGTVMLRARRRDAAVFGRVGNWRDRCWNNTKTPNIGGYDHGSQTFCGVLRRRCPSAGPALYL